MTLGSLFAGIGGFDLGFERAGFETVWQVEIDEYCRRVLERHFPRAERFGDIRECGAHNLKPVDVICGGFPCQDISTGGAMVGIGGKRSGLWKEMWRVLCELRPRFAVVENVSALLGSDLGTVLADLAAGGFDAEWDCLPASAAGLPHQRDRVFILAYPAGVGWKVPISKKTSNNSRNGLSNFKQSEYRWRSQNGGHSLERVGWSVEPEVCGSDDGISPELAERQLEALGNAVVPQIAQWIAERIKAVNFIPA